MGVTPTSRYVILGPDGSPVTEPYRDVVIVYEPHQTWEGCKNAYELAAGDAATIGEVVALVYP